MHPVNRVQRKKAKNTAIVRRYGQFELLNKRKQRENIPCVNLENAGSKIKLFIKFAGTVVYIQASLRSMVRKCCILIAGDEFLGIYMRKKLYICN